MRKLKKILVILIFTVFLISSEVKAADVSTTYGGMTVAGTVETEGEYTTIRVNAEDDSMGTLLYAIDSDAPEAFGTSNEFTVEKGSEHTIYVKDAAGNITAQVYRVSESGIDMELNLGYSDTSSAAMLTAEQREVLEKGGGTTDEKVIANGNDTDAERLFYTVETKDEHVFYLIVDQTRSDNNVYLLDQVTDEDLYALASGNPNANSKASIFSGETEEVENTQIQEQQPDTDKKSSGGDFVWVLIFVLLAGGAFYYYKIYKPKQQKLVDVSDARDIDEFDLEDEDEEELDFTVSEEEKKELLQNIINNNDFSDFEQDQEDLNYNSDMETEDEELEIELDDEGEGL